jgi:hypothetical protein
MASHLRINVFSAKIHGLEVWNVTINGVILHQFLSRQHALTKFQQLLRKYKAQQVIPG